MDSNLKLMQAISPLKRKRDEGSAEKNKEIKHSKELSENLITQINNISSEDLKWKKITAENLDLDYTILFSSCLATNLFNLLEDTLEYFTGDLAKVKVYGKWHNLPRKQVTFGEEGLTYKFSGIVTPALPWPSHLAAVKNLISDITGYEYNFVLVNRYNDGSDKASEHKDDEKDLDPNVPIASVSLGQERDFYFKHQDARNQTSRREIDRVNMKLEHGSLLLMNKPTNRYWYHALPPRKRVNKPRINLTFRRIIRKEK